MFFIVHCIQINSKLNCLCFCFYIIRKLECNKLSKFFITQRFYTILLPIIMTFFLFFFFFEITLFMQKVIIFILNVYGIQ